MPPVLRRIVAAVLAAALLSIAGTSSASAATKTLVQFPVSIDVSMRVTVAETFESIDKCTPGENGSVTYDYDFESDKAGTKGKIGNTNVSLVDGEGGTGYSLGEAGGAVERGKAGGWEISLDDCVDGVKAPEGISSPSCKTLKGKVKAGLVLNAPADDGELTPLDGDGKLSIMRSGGGSQNRSCVRLIQNTKPSDGTDFDLGLGLSSSGASAGGATAADVFTINVPGLASSLRNLASKRGTRFAQKFAVSGPCYAMTGKTNKATRSLFDDPTAKGNVGPVFGIPRYETCSVKGDGVVIVTRRGKITKVKIPS